MGLSTSEDLRGQSKMGVPPDMRKIPSKRCFHSPEDSEKKKMVRFGPSEEKKWTKYWSVTKGFALNCGFNLDGAKERWLRRQRPPIAIHRKLQHQSTH